MNATDDSERTVIHWACSGGRTNIVAWLLNEGVHPDICDSRYEIIRAIRKYSILEISYCTLSIFFSGQSLDSFNYCFLSWS